MTIIRFPETAYEILSLLSTEELLSQSEINELLDNRDKKEIKYAIRRLQENEVIQIEPNLLDMRSSSYRLSTETELSQAEQLLTDEVFQRITDAIYGDIISSTHPLAHSHA